MSKQQQQQQKSRPYLDDADDAEGECGQLLDEGKLRQHQH